MGNVIPLRPTKMRQRSGFPYAGLPMRNDALKGSKLNSFDALAPSGLTATVASDTVINLAFTVNSTNGDGTRIYISTDNVTFTEKGTVSGSTATYSATGLTSNTLYYFYAKAYKDSSESAASDTVSKPTLIGLTRNADVIPVSGYFADAVSLLGIGATSHVRYFLSYNNITRIRQDGNITKVIWYAGDLASFSNAYFQIWRKNGSNFDLVGQEDLYSRSTSNQLNLITLNTPIAALEGDFVGIGGSCPSGGTSNSFGRALPSVAYQLGYYTDELPTSPGYNWTSKTNGFIMNVRAYAQAPLGIMIGDSIVAGYNDNYSLVQDSITSVLNNCPSYQLKNINSKYVVQNLGIGGQTTTQIAARFTADVVDFKPKIAFIQGGVNDANTGVNKTTFIANYTAMLDACAANGIVPVVLKILPWSAGSTAKMQTIDDWMATLKTLTESYSGAVWVDFSPTIGEFREGGDAGNLWNIKAAYNLDNVHLNLAGYTKMAEIIDAAISPKYYLH